jgi:hypothetical protein
MPNTIDIEAKKLIKVVVDVDKFRRRYVKQDGNTRAQFVSPEITTFEKFRFYLLKNSESKTLLQKYYYRPDYLSFDEYGTTLLWPLLLYINDIPLIEEFDKDQILVPDSSVVSDLAKYDESLANPIDIDELNRTPSVAYYINLFSSKIGPKLTPVSNEVTNQEVIPVSYVRQRFFLTDVDIANKFIDLGYIPIDSSIEVKIAGLNIVTVYDYQFTIVKNTNEELRRLSWAAADNGFGPGMEDILLTGMLVEVMYAKED